MKPASTTPVTGIDLWLLDSATGKTEHLYGSPASSVTFLSHGVGWSVDEISPFEPIVAAFDGQDMLFYDYDARRLLFKQTVTGPVDGIWWPDADTCLLAIDVLLDHEPRFLTISLKDHHVTDVTDRLKPYWVGNYAKSWYAPAFP